MARLANQYCKANQLDHWRALAHADPLPKMEVIPYKASGSKYGACGIRIDGTPEFIDAVLSNLKSLLAGENHLTRLELARRPVDGSGIGKVLNNTATRAEVCYIRLHRRGNDAAMASTYFNRHLDGATEKYLDATD